MNPKKLRKLIHEPKQYFIDGHKNRKKRWLKNLNEYRPFFIKNLHHVDKLHEVNIPIASYYTTIHSILAGMKYQKGADEAIKKAIKLKPNAKNYYRFGLFLKSEKLWWRSVDAFAKAIELSSQPSAKVYHEYAYALEQMNRFEDAATAWEQADKLKPLTSYQYYRYGFTLEKSKQKEKMEIAYQKAIKLDEQNNSQELGIGIFHEKRGFWEEARKAYAKSINTTTSNAELYYKLGLANDRCYDWQTAEASFRDALLIDTTQAHYYYRLGFVCERQENWAEAATAYQHALDRQDNFTPYWFYRLGYVLEKLGKHKEANQAFLEQRVMQNAHGVMETPYYESKALQKIVNYTEYYERFALEENTILYESYHGSSMSCNPYAIFKALLEDEKFVDYKHIWVVNEETKIHKTLKNHSKVIIITRESDVYMRYLAKAKYLINNVSFPEYFIRKKGQTYLNTWHGTPIKSLGKDIKDDFIAHKNVTRNFLQASHLIQPNPYTTNIILDRYDVKHSFGGIVAETGYPRQDLMLNISNSEKKQLQEQLKVRDSKKIILYAPTWRGAHGDSRFDTQRLQDDLKTLSDNDKVHLIFRGHHMMESLLEEIEINATVVPSEIDTNSLLSIVDILITDYSSIAFDFMALEKPIIYYAYDLEEYEKERGFYFPLQDLNDSLCFNQKDLVLALDKLIQKPIISKKQREAQNKFCLYDDGLATRRVIQLIFEGRQSDLKVIEKENKVSLLFYGGPFIPNGITTSFVNLLNHIDTNKYTLNIILEPQLLNTRPERLEQLDKVNNEIAIIGRVGKALMTLEEKWLDNKLNARRQLPSKEARKNHKRLLSRETVRVFGRKNQFQHTINFEGYNPFWASLFAASNNTKNNNVLYLHNDMHSEWKLKYPYLEKNFQFYRNYNKLVSVSEQTMKHNKNNLADLFTIEGSKFVFADNIQDAKNILSKAEQGLENKTDYTIFEDSTVFINIARLSPEKDQEKLIKAFSEVINTHPKAKLVNLGSGPLENHLRRLISKLGLERNVFFLGQRSNPYPYLKIADCFVLSSNHEGQPMTLFEAMILQKSIIATDIIGNRSVIEGRSGLLVENSQEGLMQGMLGFLKDRYTENKKFNYETYNKKSIAMFENKVLN